MMPINRLPENGTYSLSSVPDHSLVGGCYDESNCSILKSSDIKEGWSGSDGIELIMSHFWIDSHFTISSINRSNYLVTFNERSRFRFSDDFTGNPAVYWLANVPGKPSPGSWNYNINNGILTYCPIIGQNINDISEIGVGDLAIEILGDNHLPYPVNNITFNHIAISGVDSRLPSKNANEYQGSCEIHGAIRFYYSTKCNINNCLFEKIVRGTRLNLESACKNCEINANIIRHIGAGGIRISGVDVKGPEWAKTDHITIYNNDIYDYGKIYRSGVGILSQQAAQVMIRKIIGYMKEITRVYHVGGYGDITQMLK